MDLGESEAVASHIVSTLISRSVSALLSFSINFLLNLVHVVLEKEEKTTQGTHNWGLVCV
jgi:hypothetical protein